MSEIMNKIPLSEIVSPELNDVNYATALSEVFNNINNNFAQLANHNFVKGDDGNSVKVIDEQIFKSDDKNQLTFIGNQLKECIESLGSKEEQLDITDNNGEVLSLWDNFNNSPGTLHMIYSNVNETNKNVIPYAVSSLPYIFLDGRFANSKIGNIDPVKYTNIKDMSCILVYDYDTNEGKGYFKVLSNAFPTMYYEHGVGLCWKINGNGTGIPVQGIPGTDGKNAVIQIVKCDNTVNNNGIITGVVNSIFGVYDGYNTIDYTNADTVAELSQLDKTSSVILITTGEYKGFYFGYTEFDINDNKLYAYCDQTTAINYGIEMQSVINALKGINI